MTDFKMNDNEIDTLSKSLTHYVFRNGVIEDIHAEGKLSNEDMIRLNKDVHNRIAGVLVALREKGVDSLLSSLKLFSLYGMDWDKCEPYTAELIDLDNWKP